MSGYKTKLIVAAIDFGTTYSGYAHSLKDEYKKDPLKIYANQDWTDGSGLITLKAPTVVLFDNRGHFHSFGYDAETKYAKLSEEDKHIGWKYFRRFKMKLHERVNLRRNMMLSDDQGNRMPALDVFSEAIKYLKDHLMKRLRDRIGELRDTDIHWVLTVPAIWHDGAKQFMKEAAAKAGIPEDQLTLALEPEAAAIYCKELVVSRAKEQKQEAKLQTFDPGSQFMVLDLGGGTVDITVHEVQRDGTLKELHSPSGGPWGGTVVDKGIDKFLDDLFGKDVMGEFRDECKTDDLDLQRTIELKKRTCKEGDDTVNLKLPIAIYEFFEEKTTVSFASTLPRTKFARSVRKKRDRLHIENEIFLQMFKSPKDSLVNHVENMLRKPELRNVKNIMMVGGFSESEIMRDAVKHAFPTKNIIVPEQPGLAVVKGAVMYGHNTDSISSRQLPFTYGVSTAVPFNDRVHPESKKVLRDGVYKCEDVFKVFIKAGTTVVPHKTKAEYTFSAPFIGTSTATVEVYRSESPNPMYISDDGCYRIGEISIALIGRAKEDKQMIDVVMMFGDTELHVTAKEHGTNNKVSAKFNFLR
ncbi:heat shock 70 kDa protein 12A-like [Ruditapes philippinarum]|uniref:heat shock 70 kDa protein 12A-like n=1 Tax=Ruditapes philippinarum TaxID=129788 RepID=UPI00295AEE5C|nr:heat shock 70 kDa protein 12A-like [Ruditapes philippinarum]